MHDPESPPVDPEPWRTSAADEAPVDEAARAQSLQQAAAAYARGDWADAERRCRRVLEQRAGDFDALHLCGVAVARMGRTAEAAELLSRAVSVRQDNANAWYHLGVALSELARHAEALRCYDRALALKPDHVRAHSNRGNALSELRRHAEALQSFEQALAADPRSPEIHNNCGAALGALGRHAEALRSYERALALKPGYVEAHNNLGVALSELQRHAEALQSFERALALRPGYAEAHNNCGNALVALRRTAEALESYRRALTHRPDYADAHCNLGTAASVLGRHGEALQCYERALRSDPDHDFLYGRWLHARMKLCDWQDIDGAFAELQRRIERGARATPPFAALAMPVPPALQRRAAEIWVSHRHPPPSGPAATPARAGRDRIHVGYFSANLHEHAVAQLIAGLIDEHDRSRFRITAFSFGPDTGDAMQRRLAAAFDAFVDVRARTDDETAGLARELQIDIAVDLMGFTQDARVGIFARRAAPIQVNYLGYPGTMGAGYIDYLIADATIIPEPDRPHYAEAIAYLPDCYQPNDPRRRIADATPRREEAELPPSGFVFCCFNHCYKITPEVFDRWMRILLRVDGSVLWLLEDNSLATRNLRAEAARRGVDADRLVFAPLVPAAEHLARHRLADLFLDTSPYNAHTTASDALWAGLPVVTCLGETLAGRVAASLLYAVRLPELVVATPEEYECLAVELATDAGRLAAIRRKLATSVPTAPLFDIRTYARHLEAAYAAMVERYLAGLAPEHIRVRG